MWNVIKQNSLRVVAGQRVSEEGVVWVGPEGKVGSEGSTENFNRSLGWGVGEEIKGEVLKPSVSTSALLWNDRPASRFFSEFQDCTKLNIYHFLLSTYNVSDILHIISH